VKPTMRAEHLRDTMGLRVEFDEPVTTELSLPNDDRLQVFAPGHPYFAFFENHARQGVGKVISDG
jgi:hypothetical protein